MKNPDLKVSVLIMAAGRGSRCGSQLPKQYHKIGDKTLLRRTIDVFLSHPKTQQIVCVIHKDDLALFNESVEGLNLPYTFGGQTRQESVKKGLECLQAQRPEIVFIHDAARPNLNVSKIDELLSVFNSNETEGAILALPVADTVKYVQNGYILKTIPREYVFRAQTPQVFRFQTVLECHQNAPHQDFTDDAAILEHFQKKVIVINGSEDNIKVTTQEDFLKVES